ncbi:MAG: tetratricopeptide repeat protein [Desulfobacteraceae bacterium]|nr:tetratricopeptide repeat protein [Desulfobacteraceae bacterium]
MRESLKKIVVSLFVVAAVVWAVQWAVMSRAVDARDYGAGSRAEGFSGFAGAQYDFGLRAWYENRLDAAENFFGRAVSIHPLHVDAWLKLAEVRQAVGDEKGAENILRFTDRLAGDVVKWKWRQLLMARQLGMEEMFVEYVNFVISFRRLRDQALDLVDRHFDQRAQMVIAVLEPGNLPDYLRWLMRRDRIEDSLAAWSALRGKLEVDRELYERYVSYLVRNKEIAEAVRIRERYTGLKDEMVNPGFESEISGHVFGWQAWSREHWDVRRDRYQARQGNYALRVDFTGEKNINFYHVRQYVPVQPGKTYSLSFQWRSRNLTTDKRPYFEIRGVNCQKSRWKTDMIAMDADWHEQRLSFEPGPDCRAVMIRMRRHRSHRFDNKIDGTVWVDGFQLKLK